MKSIITATVLILSALSVPAGELPDIASAYSNAMRHSDLVFVCEVKAEGTSGHTPLGYFKSYLVTYPESLYYGLVGLDLPGDIWIYYDSTEYPDVPEGENVMAFHKGDMFIAFLDYTDKFHVVRIDKVDSKDKIIKAIEMHTEQGVPGYRRQSAPQPEP